MNTFARPNNWLWCDIIPIYDHHKAELAPCCCAPIIAVLLRRSRTYVEQNTPADFKLMPFSSSSWSTTTLAAMRARPARAARPHRHFWPSADQAKPKMSVCSDFAEHVWKPGSCKNCFHQLSAHKTAGRPAGAAPASASAAACLKGGGDDNDEAVTTPSPYSKPTIADECDWQ